MKRYSKKYRRGKTLIVALSAALACLLLISSFGMIGEVYATADSTEPTSTATASQEAVAVAASTNDAKGKTYTVTYSTGSQSAFSTVTKAATTDASGCITLTGPALSDVVTISGGYDCETVIGSDGRYYSFTGWHIVGQSKKLPAETVFQPGDVVTPEVLETYASDGSLELEALWGKVYFIQNKYDSMTYEKVTRYYYNGGWKSIDVIALNTNTSGEKTGAYDFSGGVANKGYTPTAPIATIDHLYYCFDQDGVDPLDAYATVAMLTGDLDYVKSRGTNFTYTTPTDTQLQSAPEGYVTIGTQTNEWVDDAGYAYRPQQSRRFGETYNARAVTFKSSQAAGAGTKYNFYMKVYDDEGNIRGSIRFDNINLKCPGAISSGRYYLEGDQCGVILRLYDGNPGGDAYLTNHYFETTARMEAGAANPICQLRASNAERIVLNGGTFESVSHSWGDDQTGAVLHTYYVGRDASVTAIYGGGTNTNGTNVYTFPFNVTVTGGYVARIATTSYSGVAGSSASGDRTVRIYGGDGHQPDVDAIYAGGYGAPLTGNVDLLIKGCNNVQNVRGGGWQYTADVTGNVNVRIEDSTITGTVYGGGLYGDVFGKVNLNIVRSTVKGAIYGSGQGNVNTVEFNTTTPQGLEYRPTWWDTPETGFSTMNTETGVVTQCITHRLGRRSGVGYTEASIIWMKVTQEVYLSVAQVDSADITITDSTVLSVYGGGYLGHVVGDTNIQLINTTAHTVYGGSDGSASISGVTIYQPCDDTTTVDGVEVYDYKGPDPVYNESNGRYEYTNNYATKISDGSKYEYESLGTYNWVGGSTPAIDHESKTIVSTEMAKAGVVGGNTHVTVSGTSKITNAVYGGGKSGVVNGSTTVDIESGTYAGGVSVYGGGSAASVASTVVNIKDGTFGSGTEVTSTGIFGGGDAGVVNGGTVVNVTGGSFKGSAIYGGGKSAAVATATVNVTGGDFSTIDGNIFGGGYNGAVTGAAIVNVTNLPKSMYYVLFGGGYGGSVGSATIDLTGISLTSRVYGGGYSSGATVKGNVTITANNGGDSSSSVIYGGGYSAAVNGKVTTTINGGTYGNIYGGGLGATVGSVSLNLNGITSTKSFYGGGCNAGATVLGDVVFTATDVTHGGGYNNSLCTIYGGGDAAAVNGTITLNLHNGYFDWVYGGGKKGASKDVIINITGDKPATDPAPSTNGNITTVTQPVIGWCLRGGGDNGDCEDVTINMWAGDVCRNTHTAGANSTVASATFNMYGGTTHNIFGGGDWGAVKGNTQVNLYGGQVNTVYGGSDRPVSRVGGSGVLIDDSADATASLTILGDVYGGCDQGIVMPRGSSDVELVKNSDDKYVMGTGTSVVFNGTGCTTVEIKTGTVPNVVYAGGNGSGDSEAKEASGNANFGSILGTDSDGYSTKVLISGGTVNGAVYGGNNAAGQIAGNTLVQITGGTVGNFVYGGNLGNSSNNAVGASIAGTAYVQITGGTVGTGGYLVFGGNRSLGTVGATSVEITNMNPLDATTIYGGNHAGGTVTGQAAATVTNSYVKYIFGGNYSSGTVGSSLVTVDAATFNSAYGGNETGGTVSGKAEVMIKNGSTVENGAYGGNYQGGTVGSTQLTLESSSAAMSTSYGLYGGNNNGGTVTGDATVTLNSDMYLRVFGGNKADGTVGGSTYIEVKQGVTNSKNDQGNNHALSIYGGNNAGGTVSGNSNILIDAASGTHVTSVFGGNYINGTVAGKANITLKQGSVWYLLVGGNHNGGVVGTSGKAGCGVEIIVTADAVNKQIATPYGGNYNGGTIYGDVNITFDGSASYYSGLIEYSAYGGNFTKGTINGNVTINVKPNADIIRESNENDEGETGIQRGLYGGNCSGGTITGDVTINFEGAKDEIPYIFGGNHAGGTIGGNVTMNIANVDVRNLYGGNNSSGTIGGNMTLNLEGSVDEIAYVFGGNLGDGTINGLATVNMKGGTVNMLFGGNNAGGHIGTKGKASTGVEVNMTGGTITADLYGGSNQSGTIAGTMNLNMTGGEVRSDLFGGGNRANVTTDVTELNVNIGGTARVCEYEGNNGGWLYAGGNSADCALIPNLTVQGDAYLRYVFGGANSGDVLGTNVVIIDCARLEGLFGGSNAGTGSVTGNTSVKMQGGTVTSIRGGGNYAPTSGNTYVEQTGGTVSNRINAAGNKSTVEGNATVIVSGGTVGNIFGGADSGTKSDGTPEHAYLHGDATVTVKGTAKVTGSVYGAGNNAWAHSYGNASISISGGSIAGSVYGGGNKGELSGDVTMSIASSTVKGYVYGGGATADVGGNVDIAIKSGNFYQNVYGGGEEGDVAGSVTMNITGGEFNKTVGETQDIYGGGKNGTVDSTKLSISGTTNISGNVFGGGEGFSATVFQGTDVYIDIPFSFQVNEKIYTTDDITSSGRVESELVGTSDAESGTIGGSIYGGGNLGRVGLGTISAGGDKATIQTAATTKVMVEHGRIMGSVFGGGRGIPADGEQYDIRMGTVFGSTDVDILGGLIMGNVYGGGEQSRVYATGTGKKAATVDIIETATDDGFEKIAINGSVFGGGDRGDSDDANASVPTVYGDVSVTIQGHKDNQPSEIYFLTGGVYGDGNLCLVDGYRQITVKDFEPSPDRTKLKTFFSLQRADLAVLDNSAVVLLGATDLVEEGDNTLYSINRIGQLKMLNGSTVKLDQIVKYMGGLYSDIHDDVKYIHDGRNGFTETYADFTSCNDNCLSPLTTTQIENYHNNVEPHTAETKNVLCVANGLYLEVVDEEDEYGPVTGLFTLQLTYANPGEGGGFVYASIPDSTGDFICETERWSFNVYAQGAVTAENYQELLDKNEVFIRVTGKGFRRPGDTFDASQTYYSREKVYDSENHVIYMDIIDDVGGIVASNGEATGYTYYYWYIGGPSVTFDVEVTGYIGAANTSFQANTTLPQHATAEYSYVLFGVDVSEEFAAAVGTGGDYVLVQTDEVTGQQIAVELRADGESLGFLYYDTTEKAWGIKQGDNGMIGYYGDGDPNAVVANQLIAMKVGPANDQLTWVLHKSNDVTKTCSGLEVYLDIDLFETNDTGTPMAVTTGTSALSYTTSLEIVRLTATQSAFVQNGGNYNGVANNETVHITGTSKFTAEWQTRYVPAANPNEDGMYMTWGLSTQTYTYYMASTGEYFTLDSTKTKAVNQSDGLNISNFTAEFTASGTSYIRKSDNLVFSEQSSFSANSIPSGTRITMVDMCGSTPAYYYYICTGDMSYIDLTWFKLMGTDTTIATALVSGNKPAFMEAYDAQTMAMITERLVFVFEVNTVSGNVFEGGLTLQHLYGDNASAADILDYAKAETVGATTTNRRYFPKDVAYKFNPGSNGVNGTSYTAAFEEAAYNDIGNAVLNVHVEEDEDWINTLFRENGFAVKVSLLDSTGTKTVAMPGGMYFEYRGQYYYPGPDSTYVSVPVMEFGDHEIIIHNPQFSLQTAVDGTTANFKVEYYSAPDANYYNSFNTGESENASYTIIAPDSYSLKAISWDDIQIYESGDTVKVKYTTAKSSGAAAKTVAVTAYAKADGKYTELDWQTLFVNAQPAKLAEGSEVVCQWNLADTAAPGTYRLVFTYADHTEYVNIIIK